jgi:hypothetical protein
MLYKTVLMFLFSVPALALHYKVEVIPIYSSQPCWVAGINDFNRALVACATTDHTLRSRLYLWDSKNGEKPAPQSIGLVSSLDDTLFNNRGDIAGIAGREAQGKLYGEAFLWTSQRGYLKLADLRENDWYIFGLNNSGTVAGTTDKFDGAKYRGFTWSNRSGLQSIENQKFENSAVRGLNDSGLAVGDEHSGGVNTERAIAGYLPAKVEAVPVNGFASADYINNSNFIAGRCHFHQTPDWPYTPCALKNGQLLRFFPNLRGNVQSMNDKGSIIGYVVQPNRIRREGDYCFSSKHLHKGKMQNESLCTSRVMRHRGQSAVSFLNFLYDGQRLWKIDDLILNSPLTKLYALQKINNHGVIGGQGIIIKDGAKYTVAILLIPVP